MSNNHDALKELEQQRLNSRSEWLVSFDDFMRFEETNNQKRKIEHKSKKKRKHDDDEIETESGNRKGQQHLATMIRQLKSKDAPIGQLAGSYETIMEESDSQEEITLMLRKTQLAEIARYARNREYSKVKHHAILQNTIKTESDILSTSSTISRSTSNNSVKQEMGEHIILISDESD